MNTNDIVMADYESAKATDIERLLSQYGDSLSEVREMYPKLLQATQRQPTFSNQSLFFTASEAKDMGVDIDEGWMLKLTPKEEGYSPSLITPEKWEITEDEMYIAPTGEKYTKLELEESLKEPEIPLEIENVFGKVFPKMDIEEALDYAEQNPQGFLMDIRTIGRTPDTEQILRLMKPDITDEQLDVVFATAEVETTKQATYIEEPTITKQATTQLGESWKELTTGEFNWGELGKTGMDILGVACSYMEKYAGRPWEVAIMEIRANAQAAIHGGLTEADWAMRKRLDEAYKKYGAAAVFSEEVSTAWEGLRESFEEMPVAKTAMTVAEWVNPVYLIPIGETLGLAAKVTSKIPLLGKTMKYTAAGVQAIEKGMAYPITKPIQLTAKGLSAAGAKLGEKLVDSLIQKSEHLLLEIPETTKILDGVLVDNWMKRVLQTASKIPLVKGGVEKGLGWRVLVDKTSKVVESVVGRGAVAYGEIQRMGLNARNVVLQDLRAIEMNPTKLFGFSDTAYSSKMASRLLPEYAGYKNVGTLEHVFTHPEMYNWSGMEKGLEYVTRVNEINKSILNMLTKEGVQPKHVIEDWIHRVVTGRTAPGGAEIPVKGKPGVAGKAVGKKPSYEKARTFETMAEGMAEGIKYDPNIETSVGTYIEEAFNKMAGERFIKYTEEFGVTPAERLLGRYPGIAEKAQLTQVELADAAKLHSAVNRAIRGEKLPKQTLDALEKRFPGMGKKLRSLIENKPMNPIDDAAYQAEFGKKDMFGYPQEFIPSVAEEWNTFTSSEMSKRISSLGLEGKVRAKFWQELTNEERELLLKRTTVKPKVEGVKGLESETSYREVKLKAEAANKKAELEALRNEAKNLVEGKKAPFWQAKAERAAKMEIVRQPGIGEGYIMQPFASGKIYDQEFIDSFNKFFGYDPGIGALRVTSDVAGIMRITKAALDFSAMAIQGLPSWGLAHAYMVTNPSMGTKMMGAWYKAFGLSVASFFKPEVFAKYISKKNPVALQRVSFGGSSKAVDYFAALEGAGWTEKLLNKIPLKPFQRAEISFFSAGETVRNEFWEIMSKKALAQGKEFELARFLDRITGLTEAKYLGVPTTVRQIESSFAWFAPNYTRACLTVLSDIFRGGFTGAEVRKAIGGMLAAGGVMYSGVQFALSSMEGKSEEEAWESVMNGFGVTIDPITHEINWKADANFMTIKVGNYNFGFGGFWYGLLRLANNFAACIQEVGDKEVIDLVRIIKNGSFNKKDNPFICWWYSRSSPFVGTGYDIATNREFLGYPISTDEEGKPTEWAWENPAMFAKYIITRFEPIWMEQGLNWLIPGWARDNEIPEGIARAALPVGEAFGLRIFPESTWAKFYDKVNDYIERMQDEDFIAVTAPTEATEHDKAAYQAWKDGKLTWNQLTDTQKMNLLKRYPDLNEQYEEAQADSAIRNSGVWEQWDNAIKENRETHYKRIDDLDEQLRQGLINTYEYTQKGNEVMANYGAIGEHIEDDEEHYGEIYNYFRRKEAQGEKYDFHDNLAIAEYYAEIYLFDFTNEKGVYDWDERNRKTDAYIEKHGEETYQRVRQYIEQKKETKDLSAIWIRKAEDFEKLGREYWRLPRDPIYKIEEEGEVPTEYRGLWKQYISFETDEQKEAFLEAHPELSKDWQGEYRKANPEDDARLALWGRGKLQSIEAYNLVTQWGKELNIPLAQMGLGLPPQSMINNYFDYGDITRQFSGNSSKAKLFRLEHPEFDTWGQENWNWKPIEGDAGKYKLKIEWGEKWSESEKEYKSLPAAGYEQEWYLMEHQDFYQAAKGYYDWKEKDFSKVPTRQVASLYEQYQGLKVGKARLDFRKAHPDLDAWLVKKFGYKPVK